MKPLDYARPASLEEALCLVREPESIPLGGGTDLVPRLRSWLVPGEEGSRLISLRDVQGLDEIREEDGFLHLGAGVTLSRILEDPLLAGKAAILQEAVRDAATFQLRNVATAGGNLLQRSRCPYYRTSDAFPECLLKGGDACPARDGENRHGGIYGEGVCRSAHPSDLAPALLALDAEMVVCSGDHTRVLPLAELYEEPTRDDPREIRWSRGDLLLGVRLPAASLGGAQVYRKAMERATWSFSLASVALSLALHEGRVERIRVWLGGVASIPWHAAAVEEVLRGASPEPARLEEALEALEVGANPLSGNGYKLPLLRGLLRDALQSALTPVTG